MKGRDPYAIHYVHDMDRARHFYMEVFGVEPSFESGGWTTLDFGSFQLALHTAGEEGPLPYAGLVLEVDSIEEIQADAERLGGRMLELLEPRDGVPVRVASIQDCEGNGFDLRQQP